MSNRVKRRVNGIAAFALALVCSAAAAVADDGGSAGPPETAAGPLTLAQCMRLALEQNPGLVGSRQGVIGARAGLTRSRSSYYPQLSLAATEAVRSDAAGDDTERTEDVDVVLRQTLWQSGRRQSVAESTAGLASAEFGYAAAAQSLLEQVARDYYGALAAERLVEVTEDAVASATSHLEDVQVRIEVGVAAEVDEFTAQDDLARARLTLIDSRSSVRVSYARLTTTMGLSPLTSVELAQPSPLTTEAVPTLTEALATAEETRPDILSARASLEGARNGVRRAEINRGPTTDVSGRYGSGYTDWTRRDPSWEVSLTLAWPLFDGFATAAEVTSARASYARSQAQLQGALNEAALEVETSLAEVERTRERVAASALSVAAADARLRAAEGRYQEGVGILLEVTDARASLTDALLSQVRAEYDYRISRVGLRQVLGTLVGPEANER